MVYLKRKIDHFLMEWKTNGEKKPLVIKGPRQVGKTASIRHFAEKNYDNYIYINFIEEPKYKCIIVDGYSTQSIITNMSRLDPGKRLLENKTLIVFDEIQDFIEIATSLKFFQIDGRFDVICSGSLLGINYQKIESVSTGYKIDYELHSMDYEEFLWAKGYDDSIAEDMLKHMIERTPFNALELELYNALFMDYVILGGMPNVVSMYIKNQTFEGTLGTQVQIIKDYKEDIKSYANGLDKTRILNVFNHIPAQLAKEYKKFQITKVDDNARYRDYRGCIEWLYEAGMINICYCLNFPELPLKGNYDESKYKIYIKDTGLLVALLDEESQEDLRKNKNLGVYKGALYENLVAEAFVKSGLELYYYKKEDSTLELDFFARTQDSLVPIEVKAKDGNAKSLKTSISSEKYPDIKFGIKLTQKNIGYNDVFYTFPYFLSFLVKRFLKQAPRV
jgi:predicted AAA+ superfamily ATPase